MRRAAMVLTGALFSLVLFLGQARAADKFGYVDLSRTFNDYKKTKTYDKILTDKEKVYTDERDKKIADITAFRDKIKLLNDAQRGAKEEELQSKAMAFKEYDQKRLDELRKEQEDKMKDILTDIEEAVKKYAEKEGYTMIFNDRVLVYQDKSMDITDEVINILNKGK